MHIMNIAIQKTIQTKMQRSQRQKKRIRLTQYVLFGKMITTTCSTISSALVGDDSGANPDRCYQPLQSGFFVKSDFMGGHDTSNVPAKKVWQIQCLLTPMKQQMRKWTESLTQKDAHRLRRQIRTAMAKQVQESMILVRDEHATISADLLIQTIS